jgi:hypothetical protein
MDTNEQIAFPVKRAHEACGVRARHIRNAIKAGELVPRAVGRCSILVAADLRDWLRSRPPTKSSKGQSHG